MSLRILFLFIFCASAKIFAQENRTSPLFQTIASNDSLLFNIGFNRGDTAPFLMLLSDNFEMYHDEAGPMTSKSAFLASVRSLNSLPYKPIRKLLSMQVYPMMDHGTIYGAIETGEHAFYAREKDKPPYLTSTATFTHLWLLEQGKWKLSRVFSYDHRTPRKYKKMHR